MSIRSAEGRVSLSLSATARNVLLDGQAATVPFAIQRNTSLTNGLGDNQITRVWSDENRELASAANETIDLYDFTGQDIGAGAGRDGLGQELIMEQIVLIYIEVVSGSGKLAINSPAPSNPVAWVPTFSGDSALGAGSEVMFFHPLANAFPVEDGTAHQITFAASGGDVVYSLYIMGRHDTNESSSSSSASSSSSSDSSSSQSSLSSSQSSASSSSTS